MKVAVDVHYEDGRAAAAAVLFESWQVSQPAAVVRDVRTTALPYRAGRFYLRELPSLLAILEKCDRRFEAVLVDGYVDLRSEIGTGLGRRLFEALPDRPAVVGVAKNPLRVAKHFLPVTRGSSRRPLYVSAAGLSLERAARIVEEMHGSYRIPTLLKLADRAARSCGSEETPR